MDLFGSLSLSRGAFSGLINQAQKAGKNSIKKYTPLLIL